MRPITRRPRPAAKRWPPSRRCGLLSIGFRRAISPYQMKLRARGCCAHSAPQKPRRPRHRPISSRNCAVSSWPRAAPDRFPELSRKQLRYAPWLLWNGEPPAASLHGLLAVLLDQARVSASTLRRLICAYLRDFDGDAIGIDKAAATIREELAKGGPRLETWRTAQNEVHLFDPALGPAALAARLLVREQQPNEMLARYKLDDPLFATGKYMLAVEDAVRAAAPVILRDYGTVALERVLKIVAPGENKLRFQSRAANTARAFLQAWLVGRGEPASALQEPVRRVLLHWLNDPRLRPQRWIAVGGQETALMRRWLTRASLDLFFRLIAQNVLDAQWRYRNAFWLAYLEKGAIADAWLALGRQTFAAAGTIRELGQAYGRLKGGTANQSALLLRIGSLVVGEFTHNGSLRAWPADWPGAPRLGEIDYASTRLQRVMPAISAQSVLRQRRRGDRQRPFAYQRSRRLLAR